MAPVTKLAASAEAITRSTPSAHASSEPPGRGPIGWRTASTRECERPANTRPCPGTTLDRSGPTRPVRATSTAPATTRHHRDPAAVQNASHLARSGGSPIGTENVDENTSQETNRAGSQLSKRTAARPQRRGHQPARHDDCGLPSAAVRPDRPATRGRRPAENRPRRMSPRCRARRAATRPTPRPGSQTRRRSAADRSSVEDRDCHNINPPNDTTRPAPTTITGTSSATEAKTGLVTAGGSRRAQLPRHGRERHSHSLHRFESQWK
jgi:hypothetical protein